ncbi:hypothetical protein MMC34_004418 [Xylographa carneopallida]|nr:hypothetical protein [Xylographa carneopallida]
MSTRQWPPRSPYEALLSSPTGRRKAHRRHERVSPSPSPLKRSRNPSTGAYVQRRLSYDVTDGTDDGDEDEDEETLQLRLQALEAKLKLRKLQVTKAKHLERSDDLEDSTEPRDSPPPHATSVLSPRRSEAPAPRVSTRPKSSNAVQVPLSPEKRRTVTAEARSPGRVLLGIDKGLRGRNVSLRKAPTLKARATTTDDDPFNSNSYLSIPRSDDPSYGSGPGREKSFSQRIAETRQQDKELQERKRTLERLRRQRSAGFGIAQEELDALKRSADSRAKDAGAANATREVDIGFSREQVVRAYNTAPGGLIRRNNTASGVRNSRPLGSVSGTISEPPDRRAKSSTSARTLHRTDDTDREATPSILKAPQAASSTSAPSSELYEAFSATHLSRRILPHSFLTRTLESKTVVLLPDLLRLIKAPDFHLPPALESNDLVVLGTIASKSAPLTHKASQVSSTQSSTTSGAQAAASDANVNGKYMVLTLTDLTWTLDLYLFTTAYTRFWKLTPGTVIAVLNPGIMPPRRGREDTGRWSLVLGSSDDTVLEVGTARDLAFCKATKRDGKACDSWVDGRKTEFCEWHVDRGVENCRRGRMEVQGMSAPFAPGGKRGGRTGFFGGRGGRRGNGGDEGQGLLKEGRQYDRESRSTYFIAPSFGGGNAASLLDADDAGPGRGMSREEALRRRLAEREKEKDVARKLGEMGNGTGAEYLRLRHGDGQSRAADDRATSGVPVDAGALGLLGNNARNVQLSPLKRKASGGGLAGSRKKTRFVTAKGIREAGRESLGVGVVEDGGLDGGLRMPDEDELDIV